MASSVVLRRRISEITQCPICLDVFDTPTSLPCLHTFCLRCLRSTFVANCPGDAAVCPVCRRDFYLPAGGLAALPRNFTVDGLVDLQCTVPTSEETASNDVEHDCGVDLTLDKDGSSRPEAAPAGNTVDPDDESECSSLPPEHRHDQQRSTRSTEDPTTNCDTQAGDDEMEFCFDCRVDVCATTSGDVHRQHRRRRLGEVTAECQRRVACELAHVTDALNATYVALLRVDQRRADVLHQLQRRERLIREECGGEDADKVEQRLSELSTEKDDSLRLLVACKERLDVDQMSLETFLQDSARRLTNAATTAGLLRVVKQVKTGSRDLLSVHQRRLDQSDVDEKQLTSWTELVTTLADERPVCALTTLSDELYVARSGSLVIDVFDVDSFTLVRRLTIPGVHRTLLDMLSFGGGFSVADMTSCRRHRCLSVTSAFNVVVSCCDSLSLRVYTPLGCPVCQVSVQRPAMVGLAHAVQLDCGSFVVIGITESADRLVCVYQNDTDLPDLIDSAGFPSHMASVRCSPGSYMWLAERGGVRLLQVPASQCSADLPKVELREPEKICWDDSAQCLYVVDHGHVKVFRIRMPCDIC